MYYSVTARMKDLFSPVYRFSSLLLFLQCFIIYVLWVLYSWLLRCDCCQNWQMCFFYTSETVYKHTTKQSYPKCAFYYWLLCVKLFFFLFFFVFFLFEFYFGLKKKKKYRLELVLPFLSCLSRLFFRIQLLLKISWFLKCSGVAVCGMCLLFLTFMSL